MTNERQASITDANLAVAARVLAAAQGHRDGWRRAEDGTCSGQDVLAAAEHLDRWVRRLEALVREHPKVQVVVDGSDEYPQNLRSVEDRPALLFLDGTIRSEDTKALAVVGSRQAHEGAIRTTSELAFTLAVSGYTVVSGLARGVDTAAHEGALTAGGRTIAVVGTGIDEVFPPENGGLVDRIIQSGALVSQFPPGQGPTKTTFPARNAVIAGLSKGSIVVAANERSGTRIEIDRTLSQDRPVFLWEPFLGDQDWAIRLAERPLVHFVASVAEVEHLLSDRPLL